MARVDCQTSRNFLFAVHTFAFSQGSFLIWLTLSLIPTTKVLLISPLLAQRASCDCLRNRELFAKILSLASYDVFSLSLAFSQCSFRMRENCFLVYLSKSEKDSCLFPCLFDLFSTSYYGSAALSYEPGLIRSVKLRCFMYM